MVDPITMMVASIGMQFFNNYANSKKNSEIQKKQREFQKAAAEHDFERMRKLQAESAKLALELEAEVHKERVEDINSNYDALLENFAHSFAIQNWPLNVLPFIMKGESFGSLFNGTTQSVNMHCIFTPSNCDWFNEMFYDDIDLRLEAEMNNNWNAQSTHPIVYYGGGWSRRSLKHGVSQPNPIDLDDIELLRTKLKNVPVLVVTPYFDPWLHFRVRLWGMGKDCDMPYRIDIPHGDDVEISKRIFSYDYNKDIKEDMSDDFSNTTIEEFVPYLESLIGFVADKYFWGMYGIAPKLPSLLVGNMPNQQMLQNIFFNRYKILPYVKFESLSSISKNIEYIKDIENDVHIYTEQEKYELLSLLHDRYINMIGGKDNLGVRDLKFLSDLKGIVINQPLNKNIQEEIEFISNNENIEVWFCASQNELLQRIINAQKVYNIEAMSFRVEMKQQYISIGAFLDVQKEIIYSSKDIGKYIILMENEKNCPMYNIDISTLNVLSHTEKSIFGDFDYKELEKLYNIKQTWLNKLIEQHNNIKSIVSVYLAEAPVRNITYEDLQKWSVSKSNFSKNVSFVIGYNPQIARYYIVGLTSDRKSVYASYCNTLDESLIKHFGNNLVLTIKTTNNGI
uniref:hypothetical protein n=1 Tax=Segatella hominis TaxID=2518605 RepID=UPI004025C343